MENEIVTPKQNNLTNRDRFFYGEVFLSADNREMYYDRRTEKIMLEGKCSLTIKSVNRSCFVLVLTTVSSKEITEAVEFDKLKFVE